MPTNFPTSLDSLTNPSSGDTLAAVDHAAQHANANDALEALEAKVGADASAVTTSHDYKLGEVTGSDKAVGKTATQTLTNKTLTSPQVNFGSDANGDIPYRNGSGNTARLPIGSSGQILQSNASGLPEWVANPGASDADISTKGVVELATQAEADAGTAAGGTSAALVTRTSNIRARNFNDYIVDTGAANAYAIAPSPAISAYAEGQIFVFKAINANTTASTLAVNGLTAKAIRRGYNLALVAGDILAGQRVMVIYDATNDFFQMLSASPSPQSMAGTLINDTQSSTVNTDTAFTTNFTPKTIVLNYFLQGKDNSPTSVYSTGIATYDGTTLKTNFKFHDNGSSSSYGDTTMVVDAGQPLAGTSGGANGIKVAISITSLSSTGFTVRLAYTKDAAAATAVAKVTVAAFA
jgi:hypothetical protein